MRGHYQKILFLSVFLLLFSLFSAPLLARPEIREAIVKVYAVYNSPDYFNPWSMKGPRTRTGSGAIIQDGLILTNAHIVSDVTFLQVRRYGETIRYQAQVAAVLHQGDLALLSIDDPAFGQGVKPLDFGDLPETHTEVAVYGFPLGGDTLSITRGVVSRIEHQPYVHSSSYLLAGQIDAAINPGNSGGPVIHEGQIVGVSMQAIVQAQNIGYMVPVPIIQHFLQAVAGGGAEGFPTLGVVLQKMENPDLREYYGMEATDTGMRITRIIPGSPAHGILNPGDILLRIDGYQVANDGTIEFRTNERTWLSYAVQNYQLGEELLVEILQNQERKTLSIPLVTPIEAHRLVPMEEYDVLPSYYIFGGFVFSPLSKNLLKIWGDNWFHAAPKNLIHLYQDNVPQVEGEEVVLIIRVLPAAINDGYQDISFWVVEQVNGKRIWNMGDLVQELESNREPFTILENPSGQQVILQTDAARESLGEILTLYRIEERSFGHFH